MPSRPIYAPITPPIGLSRSQAAQHIGISVGLFDQMVEDGRMPSPRRMNKRALWHRLEVEASFTALPTGDETDNPWDRLVDQNRA
jgi:predicted DNA-binding transcriptional regulator AlpA